jgi:hypothetical protein
MRLFIQGATMRQKTERRPLMLPVPINHWNQTKTHHQQEDEKPAVQKLFSARGKPEAKQRE